MLTLQFANVACVFSPCAYEKTNDTSVACRRAVSADARSRRFRTSVRGPRVRSARPGVRSAVASSCCWRFTHHGGFFAFNVSRLSRSFGRGRVC